MNENTPVKIDYSDSKTLALLKNTVAQGATDAEFALFLEYCKSTKLNPFKKEVWFIKGKDGRIQMMTGINGFYAIANDHPQFDGLEVDVFPAEGKPVKAVARCYRKDRSRPMVAEAYFQEYGKTYGNWTTMPRVMISKCAESMALRKSFPQELNGLYTTEEMPEEFQGKSDAMPKREAKTYRYNLAATKKFIEPGQEAAIKARLKKDYGATFDKESGELVTKKPINGWDEALTINIKAHESVAAAMDDDVPESWNPETGEVDEEAEAHFAAIREPAMSVEEAQEEVKKMKKGKKAEKYNDKPIEYNI